MTAAVEDVPGLDVVGERHHADCLPDAQADARRDTAVETLDAVLLVNVCQGVHNRWLRRCVGLLGQGLHLRTREYEGLGDGKQSYLHTNNLNRLVPCRERTTDSGRRNLVQGAELLIITHSP